MKHGQPMKQTRSLICTNDSGVAPQVSLLASEFDVPKRMAGASELSNYQSNVCLT